MTTWLRLGFPGGSAHKESVCNEGDLGSIPGLGRSPGEGKGYPLQYSGLKNSMDCIAHGATKSWTQLSSFHLAWLRLGFWPRQCYKDEITVSVRMSCLYCKSQWHNSTYFLFSLYAGVCRQGELYHNSHPGTQADGGFISTHALAITLSGRGTWWIVH